MRLGVYSDDVYRREADTLYTDRAFVYFVTQLAPRFSELVVFGRLHPEPGPSHYPLPADGVRFAPLPYYPSVADAGGLLRSVAGSRRAFARELGRLDAVLLFGPHPLALAFAGLARGRGVPVFLGVRQDFPRYVGGRLPSRRWLWAVPVAHGLEAAFRALARRVPTVVVGEALGRTYARPGSRTLVTGFSLVSEDDIVSEPAALGRDWQRELVLLSVGRLDREKNPLLVLDVLARLRERGQAWRVAIAGEGPLRPELERRAAELGLRTYVELLGYLPYGPELLARYRGSHAFLHVSLTEGLPQVLWEAQAAGLPVVATDVGGVRGALLNGGAGLLVPPRDPAAAADALERLRRDEDLRRRLVLAGLANARAETREVHLERLARFLRDNVG